MAVQNRSEALRRLGEVARYAGLLAAVLYGFAWLFAFVFFHQLGVTPEEVGVGFDFLTVRILWLTLGLTTVVGALILPTRLRAWRRDAVDGTLRGLHVLLGGTVVGWGVLVWLATWAADTALAPLPGPSWPYQVGIALLESTLGLVALIMFLEAVGYSARDPRGPGVADDVEQGEILGAGAIASLALGLAVVVGGLSAGQHVKEGNSLDLVIFGVPTVSVAHSADDTVVGAIDCGVYLGSANGQVLIYREAVGVTRLPTVTVLAVSEAKCDEE